MDLVGELNYTAHWFLQLWESDYWYIPFLPILFGIGMAITSHNEQKSFPYYFRVISIKGKKKVKEMKYKPNLINFFKNIISFTFMSYFLVIALILSLFFIFVLLVLGHDYLRMDFQTYPWKWFGLMFNGFGVIFIIYIGGLFSYLFWLGIVPKIIDKILEFFKFSNRVGW